MAALFSKVTGSKYTCKRLRVYEATKTIFKQPLVKRWFLSAENVLNGNFKEDFFTDSAKDDFGHINVCIGDREEIILKSQKFHNWKT